MISWVQNWEYALRKSHMRRIPLLRNLPAVAFWNSPNVSWLTVTVSRPFKDKRGALAFTVSIPPLPPGDRWVVSLAWWWWWWWWWCVCGVGGGGGVYVWEYVYGWSMGSVLGLVVVVVVVVVVLLLCLCGGCGWGCTCMRVCLWVSGMKVCCDR